MDFGDFIALAKGKHSSAIILIFFRIGIVVSKHLRGSPREKVEARRRHLH